jgi:osmoprotectant transport system permease protein
MMNWAEILSKTGEHLYLSFTALFIACLIAIPLGIYFANHDRLATQVIRVVQVIQTIPSLALLGFMVPFFGIGTLPAIIALVLYSLLPVLQNTFTGIREVDKSLIEIGTGMGMTKRQILWLVQLPMARSFIMAGVRMAAVQTISIATIATFIGAGGLGDLIMRGLGMYDTAIILTGAIPTALLAIFLDRFLLYIDNKLTPKGLRKKNKKIKTQEN